MSGIAVHPTTTARDGQVIEQSHYIKKSEKLDNMIECAQCGFMVDLSKRSTGDSLGAIPSGGATAKSATVSPPAPGVSTTDSYADPVDTNSGCPLCNSMNPKAKGRENDPFSFKNVDISNF